MRQIQIIAIGKLRDLHLRAVCDEYLKRCQHRFEVREIEVRDAAAAEKQLPRNAVIVMLDEKGEALSSAGFAERLDRWLKTGSSVVCFVIGGADGLSDTLRARANHLLSLGKMTFPHRLVRVLLCEQLYRGLSILDGSPYHRA